MAAPDTPPSSHGIPRPAPLPEPLRGHQSLATFKISDWMQALVDEALPQGFRAKHWSTLSVLKNSSYRSQKAIAEKLRIDKATMVSIVNDLEAAGLATRERDDEDRRNYRIEITAAGRRWLRETEEAISRAEDAALSPLSTSERDTLLSLTLLLFARPAEDDLDTRANESGTVRATPPNRLG